MERSQAAGGGRNQSRRAGQVSAQVAATAKPDGYTLLSPHAGLLATPGRQAVRRAVKTSRSDFIRWRG